MQRRSILLVVAALAFATAAAAAPKDFSGAYAHPKVTAHARAELIVSPDVADPSSALPATVQHEVILTWTGSTSFPCTGATPPCTSSGYNVFRGNAAGAESATPLNAALVAGTTYTDATVTLGSSPVSYFYVVQAVETAGGVTVSSANSNEVAATFPGIPAAPVVAVPTEQ